MIDIENIVIDKVITELSNIMVTSDESKIPSDFPAIYIGCKSNTTYLDSRNESRENHANIMFQADVYDNNVDNKKENCKDIAIRLDTIMQGMGFTRTLCEPITNLEDSTIYRITMRFTAVVSKLMEGDIHYVYDK